MKTHTSHKQNISVAMLLAALCSIFALQLAVRYSSMSGSLQGLETRISALPGTHGITRKDMRSYQHINPYRSTRVRVHTAAPARRHQERTR